MALGLKIMLENVREAHILKIAKVIQIYYSNYEIPLTVTI